MNKRQKKKKQRNELLLGGNSYRKDREYMRGLHEFEISQRHCRAIPEDAEILIELGIYTREELTDMLYNKKYEKLRHRKFKKVD